jgi:CRISPR/Cas system-associated endoribonuclease Cas2
MTTVDPSWWTVTFDVATDRDRYALTQRLRRHGLRILYSVFAVSATDAELDRVLAACRDRIGATGHLLAVPRCPACEIAEYGAPIEHLPEHGWTVR